MSKYESLWKYLKINQKNEYLLSFDEIKNILGFPIDHTFLNAKKEAIVFGYKVGKISTKKKMITFYKV